MSKVVIKFNKSSGNYTKGDIAGFEKDQAEKYVNAKIADYVVDEKSKAEGSTKK